MPTTDNLGTRMKGYEQVSRNQLMKRTPVAIRIDGKAFHTFTKGFDRPFDYVLHMAMAATTKELCENIQGCVFGYTQSDEITLILLDYQNLNTSAWFNYEVQKLCSITASMATLYFYQWFNRFCVEEVSDRIGDLTDADLARDTARHKGAAFDARAFNIPKEEVCNLIYWRQLDATRNSIQLVAQSQFSHKELHGLSCNTLQDKLLTERNINWNDYPIEYKRGVAVYKDPEVGWMADFGMPILNGENREYINKLIYIGEE